MDDYSGFWDDLFSGNQDAAGVGGYVSGVGGSNYGAGVDYGAGGGSSVFGSGIPAGGLGQGIGSGLLDTSGSTTSGTYGGLGGGGIVDSAYGLGGAGGGFGSNFDLGAIARGIGGLGSAAAGLNGLNQARTIGGQAAAADPLAPYRSGFAAQLAALMGNPSGITNYPGYKAGLEAVQRAGAAQGFNGSGNMMTALADYGGKFFDQAIGRLAGLAGGTAGGGLPATQSSINLTNASLNRILSGIASMGT